MIESLLPLFLVDPATRPTSAIGLDRRADRRLNIIDYISLGFRSANATRSCLLCILRIILILLLKTPMS